MATLYFSNQNVLVKNLKSKIGTIEGKIPSAASADNQLADKAYVDTSLSDHISSLTAAFNGSYATYADLSAATGMNKNDYAVVLADENNSNECWRYKYDGTAWKAEYRVNETALTTEQNNALNSGITAETVTNLSNIVPDTATSDNKLATVNDITTLSTTTTTNLDTKMDKKNPSGSGTFMLNSFGTQGECAVAIGSMCTSSGSNSFSGIFRSAARGDYSIALGCGATASGEYSAILGGVSNNIATGQASVILGGQGLKASSTNQVVIGQYNYEDSNNKYLFIAGNGASNDRANMLALDVDGNLYLRGTVYINADKDSTNGTSLSDFIKKNGSLKFTGTLTAGDTILTFADTNIKEDMFINVYASQYGVMPDSVTVEAGKVTLTFDEALDSDVTFGIRLESFEANESTTTVTSSKPTTTA